MSEDLSYLKLETESDRQVLNLAHKASQIISAFTDRLPNARELEEMTRVFGLDLVTFSLIKILSMVSPNCFFVERVDQAVRNLKQKKKQAEDAYSLKNLGPDRPELCVIASVDPFAKRKWAAHVGAWRAWGRALGFTTEVISTKKGLHPLQNANLIRQWLKDHPHEHRVIATLGQGGAEFRILLEQLLKVSRHELYGIKMWMNVSGVISGTPILRNLNRFDREIERVTAKLRGWSSDISDYLDDQNPRIATRPDFSNLPFITVSLSGLLQMGTAPGGLGNYFFQLMKNGPNDGVVSFHNSIVSPGYVIPISGMSHYTEDRILEPWFRAVLMAHLDDLQISPKTFDKGFSQPLDEEFVL